MLGETKFVIKPQFFLAIDPRAVAAEYAEKPRLKLMGLAGIALAGVGVLLWFRR